MKHKTANILTSRGKRTVAAYPPKTMTPYKGKKAPFVKKYKTNKNIYQRSSMTTRLSQNNNQRGTDLFMAFRHAPSATNTE